MAIGDGARLGWQSGMLVGEEATWGTKASTSTLTFVEFNSESLKIEVDKQRIEQVSGSRDYDQVVELYENVGGTINVNLDLSNDGVMKMIKHAFGGTVVSATVGAGCIKHTFNTGDGYNNQSSVAASDFEGLTTIIRRGDTTSAEWYYAGLRVDKMTLKAEAGQIVTMNLDLIGKTGTTTTDTITQVVPTLNPVVFHGVTVLNSITAENFTGFELTLNNNLQADDKARQLGNKSLGVLPFGRLDVMLKLTQRMDTATAWDRFRQNTTASIHLKFDTGITAGAVAGNTTYNCDIHLPKVYFTKTPEPEIGDSGILMQEIEATAVRDSLTGYTIQMNAWNGTAGY